MRISRPNSIAVGETSPAPTGQLLTDSAIFRFSILNCEAVTEMVTSIILLKAKRGTVKRLAENLAERPGISEVYSVSGNFDLVAIARVANNDALADLVTSELAEVDDISHSETMLAFRTFSRHDLQSMFSIGM